MRLIELRRRNLFATVEIVEGGDGFSCEWWVSGKYDLDLRVLGCYSFPVFGVTEEEVRRKVEYLRDTIFDLAEYIMGGSGAIHTRIPAYRRQITAMRHIARWWEEAEVEEPGTLAAFYNLACEFKLKNPAVVLAELYGVPVRTMHDRLAAARETKLIKKVSRGRSY